MADLIDRQTAIKAIHEEFDECLVWDESGQHTANEVESILTSLPSVVAQPVRHGHWETIEGWDGDELYRCSECGAEFVLIDGTPKDNDYWFCPHCGADMRGEQNG